MQENYEDEISLKILILKLREFWRELLRNWWMVIIFCVPFLAIFLYKHFTHIKKYQATLTFMVNDTEGGASLGGVSGVLGSFGLGGGSGGDYNLEKMLSLLKSRKIVQEVLLDTLIVDGKEDFFANHLIHIQGLNEMWSELESTKKLDNFLFTHPNIPLFNLDENTALKFIHNFLIGNAKNGIDGLLSSNISTETGIMEIGLASRNEQLSIGLTQALYHRLSKFYIDKSIEKQLNSYNVVTAKADSLERELRNAEYSLANFQDSNRGLYNRKDQVEELRLQAKVRMLGTAFVKVVEQKEIAEFSLNDKTPVVQIIDLPISPLEPSKSSLIKNLLIACLVGGFLSALFIISRKIIRDALA